MSEKKIKIAGMILTLIVAVSTAGIFLSNGAAEDVFTGMIYEDSFDSELGSNWSAEKFSAYSDIHISDGRLIASCEAGAMEFSFTDEMLNGFVMEFDATRLAGNGYFGIKYAIQADSSAFESRVYMSQADEDSSITYYEDKGKAVDFREVKLSDVAEYVENSNKRGFNFFYEEIGLNKTYHYLLAVNNGRMEFYIDGTEVLHEYWAEGFTPGKVAFRLSENMRFAFDNLRVYSPVAYAENKISSFKDPAALSDEEVLSAEQDILDFKFYRDEFLSEAEVSKVENLNLFDTLLQRYENLIAPKIYLNGTLLVTADPGTKIALPAAQAFDRFGREVKVFIEVMFNEKYLKVTDGAFTPYESGKYILRFNARDVLGNTACREFEITVR